MEPSPTPPSGGTPPSPPRPNLFLPVALAVAVIALALGALLAVAWQHHEAGADYLKRQLAAAQERGDENAEAELLARLIAHDPANAQWHRARAQLAVDGDTTLDLDEVLAAWAKDTGSLPDEAVWFKALQALAEERPWDAIGFADAYLCTAPLTAEQRRDGLDLKARASLAAGQLDEARAALDERLAIEDDGDVRMARAELAARQGRWDDAIADAQAAGERFPQALEVQRRLAAFERLADRRNALAELDQQIQERPQDPEPLFRLGVLLFHLGFAEAAVPPLTRATEITPGSLGMRIPLAVVRCYAFNEDPPPPIVLPAAARSGQANDFLDTNDTAFLQLTRLDNQLAQQHSQQPEKPGDMDLLGQRAELLVNIQPALALAAAEEMLARDPASPQGLFVEQNALLALDRPEEALERASHLPAEVLRPGTYAYIRAVAEDRRGNLPGALAAIDEAIAARPDFIELRKLRADYLLRMGRRAEAEAELQRAQKAESSR